MIVIKGRWAAIVSVAPCAPVGFAALMYRQQQSARERQRAQALAQVARITRDELQAALTRRWEDVLVLAHLPDIHLVTPIGTVGPIFTLTRACRAWPGGQPPRRPADATAGGPSGSGDPVVPRPRVDPSSIC